MKGLEMNWGSGLSMMAVLVIMIMLLPLHATAAEGPKESKWAGVDEAVIEKFAKEHGREAKEPLIGGEDQGDIMLFLFLLAGTIGGFAAGYYWRILISERRTGKEGPATAGPMEVPSPAGKRE